jgi:hypothetical protein
MTTDNHVGRMIVKKCQDGATSQIPPWILEEAESARTVGEIIRERPWPPVELNQGLVDGAQLVERPREVFRCHVHQVGVNAAAVEVPERFRYGVSRAAMPPAGVEVYEEHSGWASIHPLSTLTLLVSRTWAAEA